MKYVILDVPVGENLQQFRKQKHMTQTELIVQMQLKGSTMSRSTLANIETGRRNIKISDLKILLELLEVEFSEIF